MADGVGLPFLNAAMEALAALYGPRMAGPDDPMNALIAGLGDAERAYQRLAPVPPPTDDSGSATGEVVGVGAFGGKPGVLLDIGDAEGTLYPLASEDEARKLGAKLYERVTLAPAGVGVWKLAEVTPDGR